MLEPVHVSEKKSSYNLVTITYSLSKCIAPNSALNIKVVVGNGSECFKALIISLLNQVLHILVNENAGICFCTACTVVTLNTETGERTYITELNDLRKNYLFEKT